MPTFYETHISVIGMARDGVFYLLAEAAEYRRRAKQGPGARSYNISQARACLALAYCRDLSARREGFRLA